MSWRFLALRTGGPAQHIVPDGWQSHSLGDVSVCFSGSAPALAFQDELLIVGDLFKESQPVRLLEPGRAHVIIASDGRWLAEHGWGRFVAFWKDQRGAGVWVYRDPSGHVPVHLHHGGALLAFSDLDDAMDALPGRPRVDVEGLAHRLVYGQLQTQRTALEGIEELLPGERALLGRQRRDLLWSPWHFVPAAAERRAERPPEPSALKTTVANTVKALTSAKHRALLELSGGLDSSILAACLAEAEVSWLALTVVTPGQEGDERAWAAAVAERLNAELHTAIVDADSADIFAMPSRLTASPGGFGMLRAADRAVSAAASELGVDALISGTGGDNVFCSLRSPAPLIDAWRLHGPAGALRTARDLGRLTQTGPWEIARQTRAYLRLERLSPHRWRATHDLLAPTCRPAFAGHPWLDAPATRLSGSRGQIVMLLRAHAVTAAHDRMRNHDMIFPLLAQPILEACLAIASPHWIAGGQDRSVAREAFRPSLPARTIARRSKGRRDDLVARAFDQNRRAISERLGEGRLAGQGLVDGEAVRTAAARPAASDDLYMRLLELLDAELWQASIERRPSR